MKAPVLHRSLSLTTKRIRQTPQTFSNAPAVFGQLLMSKGPMARKDITFDLRESGYRVITPNALGARFPLYEIFADDAYSLSELLADVPAAPVVLDIGAQIGAFSLAVAAANPNARVHSYEASPTTAKYLKGNVDRNNLEGRITVHATAMAGAEGEFTLLDTGTASGHNGLTAPEGIGAVEVTVPATTFDKAVAEAGGRVDLVKMDVEGAEYEILANSSPESWTAVRRVVMEYHPLPGHSLEEIENFFAGVGLHRVRHESVTPGLGALWLARKD